MNEYQNNNKNNQNQEKTNESFTLRFDQQIPFREMFATNIVGYTTSTEIITLAKALFNQYADFVGVSMNVAENGLIYLTLRFDHLPHPGQITAFSSEPQSNPVTTNLNAENNEALAKAIAAQEEMQRMIGMTATNAGRYYITQAGKDGIGPFIYRCFRNNNGNLNWEDHMYRDSASGNAPVTDLDWIDPCEIIKAKCSNRENPFDRNSSRVNYLMRFEKKLNEGNYGSPVYQLAFTQVMVDNLTKVGATLGCATTANDGFSYINR